MAWIKSKCGKYELEFKKLQPGDLPEGWDADPKNLPPNTREIEPAKKEEKAPEESKEQEAPKEAEAQEAAKEEKSEKAEKPKKNSGKRGRGRRKASESKKEDDKAK